jgi:hypothetical protein
MTRDEYRAEIERLKRECQEAEIERTMREMERVGLTVSTVREDGVRLWTVLKFPDEEARRRLDLLDDRDDLEDPTEPFRERIAKVRIDYVYEWVNQDRDWWTAEQMAEECEIPRWQLSAARAEPIRRSTPGGGPVPGPGRPSDPPCGREGRPRGGAASGWNVWTAGRWSW